MTDRNDVGDVNPTSLAHLIGQRHVVEQVRVALDAAHMDGKKFDDSLLVGPPGLGKSAVARVIAQEMGTDFHETLGQSIREPADLFALVLAATDRAVVHIDECHELGKEYQTTLFMALDQKRVVVGGGRSGRAAQSVPLSDFTLLLSTTDEYGLLQPLRDRMKLTLRFEHYAPDELSTVVRHRSQALGWPVEPDVFPLVAQRSRGTPRLALRLLQAARRVSRADGDETIICRHLRRACDLERIDRLGLGPTERRYLELLSDGSNRLNVLSSVLGLPTRTIAQVVEPYLLRAGLVLKDDQGRRQLTAPGRDHLLQCGERRDSFGEQS